MSHPSRVDIFRAWAKAMVEGATVGKPNYGKSLGRSASTLKRPKRRRRRRKKKKEE